MVTICLQYQSVVEHRFRKTDVEIYNFAESFETVSGLP
jgi:hypothetical protein